MIQQSTKTSCSIRRGGSGHELEDEMAAQQDAQREADEAIAEGDERPTGQSFTQRAIDDATYDAGNQGTLSEEFAEKEGASWHSGISRSGVN